MHDWPEGGKARSWNRYVREVAPLDAAAYIFMDGDAEIAPGSFDALAAALAAATQANAAAGLPLNGRRFKAYQAEMRRDGGLFGDLYALAPAFLDRIRARGLALPEDLIGDDGLIAAWARTDLGRDADARPGRVVVAEGAGFRCEPASLLHPATWRTQHRRMRNYALRHFQNRILSDIMGREGPAGIPARLASRYGEWLPRLRPRGDIVGGYYDRVALRLMRERQG